MEAEEAVDGAGGRDRSSQKTCLMSPDDDLDDERKHPV
jgi:hypothetical protein